MDFIVNSIKWHIMYVDANSRLLQRSDGVYTLGVTDNRERIVFINKNLKGRMLTKVITHELVHVAMFSYHIHIPLDQEEFIADYIATYGRDIIDMADEITGRVARIVG